MDQGANGRILFTARFNLLTRHVDRVVAKIGKEVRIHEVPLSPADDGFSDDHYAGSLTGSAGCSNGTSTSFITICASPSMTQFVARAKFFEARSGFSRRSLFANDTLRVRPVTYP